MHGHALSTTRKLNRHWQSGNGGSIYDKENLVLFEKELDPTQEWYNTEEPYLMWNTSGVQSTHGFLSYGVYGTRDSITRTEAGFLHFNIKRPGNYRLHWDLHTRLVEQYTDAHGDLKWRILDHGIDDTFGIFGTWMYGLAQTIWAWPSKPLDKDELNGVKFYTGAPNQYIANKGGDLTTDFATSYINDDIVKYVSPFRTSTKVGLPSYYGANTFNLKDLNEQPPLIFHIGDKHPYYNYTITILNNEAYFAKSSNKYTSPPIALQFITLPRNAGIFIVYGKIWLERIGNYTQEGQRWLPRIYEVPTGITILGDGGII